MKTIEKLLEGILSSTVAKVFPEADSSNLFVQRTANPVFGDFQTNFAMAASKQLKMQPRLIAEKITEALSDPAIAKTEIAGPGFINIHLSSEFLGNFIRKLGTEPYDYDFLDRHGDVVIDYSSPNIAKRMHIGHLRSTVIGDSIKRIYNKLGFHTISDNHIGDWGTQYGKLIVAYRGWLDKEAYEQSPVEELERIYVEFERQTSV